MEEQHTSLCWFLNLSRVSSTSRLFECNVNTAEEELPHSKQSPCKFAGIDTELLRRICFLTVLTHVDVETCLRLHVQAQQDLLVQSHSGLVLTFDRTTSVTRVRKPHKRPCVSWPPFASANEDKPSKLCGSRLVFTRRQHPERESHTHTRTCHLSSLKLLSAGALIFALAGSPNGLLGCKTPLGIFHPRK